MARKALCVGISYQQNHTVPREMMLPQAYQDASKIKSLLEDKYGYSVTLLDDSGATHDGMLNAMRELVDNATDGDQLVFHFSGHGSQVPCQGKDESDGQDEVLWPSDIQFNTNEQEQGYILDNLIHEIVVKDLPDGVRLTIIMDCCHSGTAADLPDPPANPKHRGPFKINRERNTGQEPAIVAWSACKDPQVTMEFKSVGGLLVHYLCNELGGNTQESTYGSVLADIRQHIQDVYTAMMAKDQNMAQFVNANAGIPRPDISVLGDYDEALQDRIAL